MAKPAKSLEVEWSVMIRPDDIPAGGRAYDIEPDASQMKALAKRFDVVTLDKLKATVSLKRDNAHIVHVQGRFDATVTQNCVMTLEPVVSDITDEFEAWYADESQAVSFKRAQYEAKSKKELLDMPMLDESEDPEPMVNGQVDIGDLVSQYVSLAIPPYPTKEGLTYSVQVEEPVAPKNNLKLNPFAALKDWRPKD